MELVTLRDPATGNSASILVSLGFNCFEWTVNFADGPRDLLWAEDGFATGDKRPSGSGIPLLFPFPGRIGHGRFRFAGRDYEVQREASQPHALHGFVFNRPWELVDQTRSRVTAEFHASKVDPAILQQWPSDFRVQASYELVGNELRFEATFSNVGDGDLPWGFGTHAYFRVPLAESSSSADSVLTVPVDRIWQLEDMLPTGEQTALTPGLDFSTGVTLAEHQLDDPFSLNTKQGAVQTVLADPTSGRRLVQEFDVAEYPYVVMYTPGHRESLCIEPYTCIPDPFRLPEQGIDAGLRILPAGEHFQTKTVLRAEE